MQYGRPVRIFVSIRHTLWLTLSRSCIIVLFTKAYYILTLLYRIKPDFHKLSMELKKLALSESRKETEQNLETELKQLEERIGSIQAPNMKANQKWDDINAKVREQQAEFDELRKDMKVVQEKFHKIKQERHNKFMTCFKKISHKIESIYKVVIIFCFNLWKAIHTFCFETKNLNIIL